MSYDISIRKTRGIKIKELLQNLKSENVRIGYISDGSTDSELNGFLNLYIDKESTRGANISTSEEEYTVMINAVASEGDYDLVKDVCISLATLSDCGILPESEEQELEIDVFEKEYFDTRIKGDRTSSASAFKRLILNDKSAMKIPCCVRPFYLGIDTINEIDSSDDMEYYSRLCERIRRVQYLNKEEIRIPEAGKFEGEDATLIIFNDEPTQFLPRVDNVFLSTKEVYKIPYMDFIKSENLDLERLDESQFLVKNVDSQTIQNLCSEFAKFIEQAPKPTKKWWKFW